MRGWAIVLCGALTGCSPEVGRGAADGSIDVATVDGPPFNSTHRGLVQVLYTATMTPFTSYTAGFYKVPVGAGCTWTFSGPCSLAQCENAGLEAVSAGTLTWTIGASTVVMEADGALAYKTTSPAPTTPMPPGTAASVASTGGQVDMFTSTTLVMPQPAVSAVPASAAMVPRTQALAVSWTATNDDIYITIAQGGGGVFPNLSARNLRCEIPGATGQFNIPVDLLGQFIPGTASFTIAAMAAERKEIESYDVTIRMIASPGPRSLMLQ